MSKAAQRSLATLIDVGTVVIVALVGLMIAMPRLAPWLQARGISKRYAVLVAVVLFMAASWFTYRDLTSTN